MRLICGTTRTAVSILCLAAMTFPLNVAARDARDKTWLLDIVRNPPAESPRRDRYAKLLGRGMERFAGGDSFGVDVDWLRNGTGRGLDPARGKLNALARLAFCYATAGMPCYGDSKAAGRIREGLLGVADNVDLDGTFKWGVRTPSHEHAWLLESSLLAFIWSEELFSDVERERIHAALFKAATFLAVDGSDNACNQGSVRAAIVALAALYFEKPDWMSIADRHADAYLLPPAGNIYEDGEIGEHFASYGNGGGPDCNYTYTGMAYVYAYRLWSGRSEIDATLVRAGRWLVGYRTLSGYVVVPGASARVARRSWAGSADCLPFYEMLSRSDPFFAEAADLELAIHERRGDVGGHLVSPVIWAAREAGAQPGRTGLPEWQANRTEIYGPPLRTAVCYGLFSRAYQTGVVFANGVQRGRDWPLRGLQTWAWESEPPLIAPGWTDRSFVSIGDVDSSMTNVSRRGEEWDVVVQKGAHLPRWGSELAAVIARRGPLGELYALTPRSFVVVYGTKSAMRVRWALNASGDAVPTVGAVAKVLRMGKREGCIRWLGCDATLEGKSRDLALVADSPGPICAFGFSNSTFAFSRYDGRKQIVEFRDESGRYRLAVGSLLAPDDTTGEQAPLVLSAISVAD